MLPHKKGCIIVCDYLKINSDLPTTFSPSACLQSAAIQLRLSLLIKFA